MIGFRLLGSVILFWVTLIPGWLYINSRVTSLQIMTIDSPERDYFFGFLGRLLLGAVLITPLGFWGGGGACWAISRYPKFRFLLSISLLLGSSGWAATAALLFWSAIVLHQPGLKPEITPRSNSSLK